MTEPVASSAAPPAGASPVDQLLPLMYDDLCRIARRQLGGEREGHTLDTTALVHEAYLKLSQLNRMEWRGRPHFLSAAAGTMRRILIDYALARQAQKRGGVQQQVPLEAATMLTDERAEELCALNDALERLARESERAAQIVEWRFFGGMTIEETAEVLQLSPATVKREWNLARAWLNRELQR
jgi:RNA polymerase sigma factor (TIGR02999 family)